MLQFTVPLPPNRRPAAPCRAIVGGREFVLGGWGAYEADRRAALWELESRPYRSYYSAEVLGPDDAVRSLTGGSRGFESRALTSAAARLQLALGQLEDRYCIGDDGFFLCAATARARPGPPESLTIPPLTAADLRAFLEAPSVRSDPTELYELGMAAGAIAAESGAPLPDLPPPTADFAEANSLSGALAQPVPIGDNEAVLRLEASVAPRIARLEALQAAVATRLDQAAVAIEARLGAHAPNGGDPPQLSLRAPRKGLYPGVRFSRPRSAVVGHFGARA